jgi:hypothetical protein
VYARVLWPATYEVLWGLGVVVERLIVAGRSRAGSVRVGWVGNRALRVGLLLAKQEASLSRMSVARATIQPPAKQDKQAAGGSVWGPAMACW